MAVIFLAAARKDIREARDWYKSQATEPAKRFVAEIDHQISRISEKPYQFPVMFGDLRKASVQHFPYILLFREMRGDIYIIACFHTRRDPQRWKTRV